MRRRTSFVLGLALLLVWALPTAAAATGRADRPPWDEPAALVRRGDYLAAERVYARLAEELGPGSAPQALLLQARAALEDDRPDDAEAALQRLLASYSDSAEEPSAWFSLALARRAAGNCRGALRALDAYQEALAGAADPLGPYTPLQRAACLAEIGEWPAEVRAAQQALATDGGGPRLTRIEGYERLAEASLKLGQKQEALDSYNHGLELAGTRGYTAEMLFTTATIARALGDEQLATERLAAVVRDYPDTARAPDALDALVEMGRNGVVSPYQAGLVRQQEHDEARAASLFEQVDPASPDAGPAHVSHAAALLRLDRADEAEKELQATAEGYPEQAGPALLRLGQALERQGSYARAEQAYSQMGQAAPDRLHEALFHVGLARYLRGDVAGALEAWRQAFSAGGSLPNPLRAELALWKARALEALTPGTDEAREALQAATAAAPDTYFGLRAQELLRGQPMASSRAQLADSPSEAAERAEWLASFGTTTERVRADLAADPGLQRADGLLAFGLRTEASWETEAVMTRYGQATDVAHLSGLADWLAERELPYLALRTARFARDLVGLSSLPRAVQKQVYPAAFGDLIMEQAQRYDIDPLLLLAIVRQESSFDPRAQSGAQARGLTQIVPPTARDIADRLGRADAFVLRDLYKPSVSLEFGAWFLSRLLFEHQGRLLPALAAYDAGGGNVARWLSRFGDDPDVLVEEVPFAETQTYLRAVYANYLEYKLLYGSG